MPLAKLPRQVFCIITLMHNYSLLIALTQRYIHIQNWFRYNFFFLNLKILGRRVAFFALYTIFFNWLVVVLCIFNMMQVFISAGCRSYTWPWNFNNCWFFSLSYKFLIRTYKSFIARFRTQLFIFICGGIWWGAKLQFFASFLKFACIYILNQQFLCFFDQFLLLD